ncbi:MAG: hypothetical protein V2A73_12465 [Pseudomonadota bacterium]
MRTPHERQEARERARRTQMPEVLDSTIVTWEYKTVYVCKVCGKMLDACACADAIEVPFRVLPECLLPAPDQG